VTGWPERSFPDWVTVILKKKNGEMLYQQSGHTYFYPFIIILMLMASALFAQSEELMRFNDYRHQLNQTAMLTLGGWALGNIAVGSALYFNASGQNKYFHQMNVAWNLVNLSIAGFGYYSAVHPDTVLNITESLKQQSNIEKILLFNAGLDVAYVMTGFYLKERAKHSGKNSDRFRGYGNSLILQGSFLFVFDLTVYYFQMKNQLPLETLLSSIYFKPGGIGVQLTF
jgi:hypothetical protein